MFVKSIQKAEKIIDRWEHKSGQSQMIGREGQGEEKDEKVKYNFHKSIILCDLLVVSELLIVRCRVSANWFKVHIKNTSGRSKNSLAQTWTYL